MSRKPIPADAFDHGDHRRYQRGCRCRPCTTAVTAAVSRRRYLRATGRALLTTPNKAAAHIERLRAAGMTDTQILRDARMAPDTLYRIIRRSGGLLRTTETRILAIKPTQQNSKGSGANVPALGTVRRLRALAADGWPAVELGRRAGKHKQFIVHLQNMDETGQVRMWVADYVRRLQEDLADLAPDDFVPAHIAERTRRRAATKDWSGSGYWDSEDFDNPEFQPAASDELNVLQLGAHRRQEIAHLAACNVSEHEIADRLGMARAYVHDLIRDMGKAA